MATFNAMDVWQTVCYLTVFFSVLEFCFVIYLTQKASWEDGLGIGKKKVDIVQNQKESHKVKIFVTTLFYFFVHGMPFDYFEVLMLNIYIKNQKEILLVKQSIGFSFEQLKKKSIKTNIPDLNIQNLLQLNQLMTCQGQLPK